MLKKNINKLNQEVPEPKKYKSLKTARLVSTIFSYILLVLLCVIWLYPIVWIVLNAFRVEYNGATQVRFIVAHYFPKGYGLENFEYLFANTLFLTWFKNTLFVAVFSCIFSTIMQLSVAYCMSKLRFKMRKPFMNIAMILGLFPGFMSMIAIYYILKSMGLTQNLAALILVNSAGAGVGFQIAKGYFDIVPNSLIESARLDGCTNFQIFYKIILPLSKPIIIYTALMSFTGPWMDFIFARVILGVENTH